MPTDGTRIVTYCYTGHTGQISTTLLNILGYNAINLKYGICSWTQDEEVRATQAFKDPNDSHDYPIDIIDNLLSDLENYDPPTLAVEGDTALEVARAAAANYLSDTDRAPTMTAQALHTLMYDGMSFNDPFIVSVRSPDHYQVGHIPGAYNIPYKEIANDENLRKIPTDRQIVTYCYTGHTGQLAATILNILGYNAVNLKFGIMSWTTDQAVRYASPFTDTLGVDSFDFDIDD